MPANDLFDLSGKVAIVTGSTKGIGKAIAARYAQYGAKVVVSSRKVEVCEQVADEINRDYADRGGEAWAFACFVLHRDGNDQPLPQECFHSYLCGHVVDDPNHHQQ